MIRKISGQSESGVVSLLTVIFFMVFLTIITVGYLGLVASDQRQTTDNDLSASALAAARSGVEDGKRILLYCQSNPTAVGCAEALSSQNNCSVFKSGSAKTLTESLGIFINSSGQGMVGGAQAAGYQQYYSCLTIQKNTSSITVPVRQNSAAIRPLKATGAFNTLDVSWSGEGNYANNVLVQNWLQYDDWNIMGYIPLLQLQIIPYPAATIGSLDAIEANSKTVYIVPCVSGSCMTNASTDKNFANLDIRDVTPGKMRSESVLIPKTFAACTLYGGNYSCSVKVTGLNGGPGATRYYVRAAVVYAPSTTLTLGMRNNNTVVDFDGVQPWVDVTGRTSDVFRRVRAQVTYAQDIPLPQNALDSAAPICKDMIVTPQAETTTLRCGD